MIRPYNPYHEFPNRSYFLRKKTGSFYIRLLGYWVFRLLGWLIAELGAGW